MDEVVTAIECFTIVDKFQSHIDIILLSLSAAIRTVVVIIYQGIIRAGCRGGNSTAG